MPRVKKNPRLKRQTKLVRVDAEVWNNCERIMPGESGPTISRMLYNNSLFRAENFLREWNKEVGVNEKKRKKSS